MTRRQVKVMPDYGAFPLWAGPGLPADWLGMLGPGDLPLSAPLVGELWAWADLHDSLLGPEFAWPSEQSRLDFNAEGHRLVALVRDELGCAYDVADFEDLA